MANYIEKAAVTAMIDSIYHETNYESFTDEVLGKIDACRKIINFLDTLPEVCIPKFHKGDWIVFNGSTLYIKEVVKGFYRTVSRNGIPNSYDWNIDNAARLWNIQDAKDGDVLAVTMYPEGTWIGIFKEQKGILYANNGCVFSSHCFVNTKGIFNRGIHNHTCGKAIHPATKEQRDALMKAMADAGYTFDFEKKKLRELKHKPTKWDKEDEERLKNILSALDIQVCCDRATGKKGNLYQKEIDWLKSLSPHKQWKPSNVQMQALKEACDKSWEPDGLCPLYTLYEQLKKLTN